MWQSSTKKKSSSGTVHCTPLRSHRDFHVKRIPCRLTFREQMTEAASSEAASSEAASAEATPPTETTVDAYLLLNDLSPSGVALFTAHCIPLGCEVTLELDHPEKLTLNAQVGWCQMRPPSVKILSDRNSVTRRLGLVFDTGNEEQQKTLQAFCERIAAMYPGMDLTRAPYAA